MSTLALLTATARTPITLRQFLTEMEAAIARNPWLADAPLYVASRQIEFVRDAEGNELEQETRDVGPSPVELVAAGCSASTHYVILK